MKKKKRNNCIVISVENTNTISNGAKIISRESIKAVERINTISESNTLLLHVLHFKEMISLELYNSNYKNKNLSDLYELLLAWICIETKLTV